MLYLMTRLKWVLMACLMFHIVLLLGACGIATPLPIATATTVPSRTLLPSSMTPSPVNTSTHTSTVTVLPTCTPVPDGYIYVIEYSVYANVDAGSGLGVSGAIGMLQQALEEYHPEWAQDDGLAEYVWNHSGAPMIGVNPQVLLVTTGVSLDWQILDDHDLREDIDLVGVTLTRHYREFQFDEDLQADYPQVANASSYALYAHFDYDLEKLEAWQQEYDRMFGEIQPRIKPSSIPTPLSAPKEGDALQPKQPPACTFPLAHTTMEESTPEEYTFSEPQKVNIDLSFKDIDLYQWLPDNQRVLIGGGRTEYSETGYSIELLNPQTGESQIFGARPWPSIDVPPIWVPGLDAVIYPTTLIPRSSNPPLTRDSNGIPIIPPSRNYRRQLWLSKGDPANVQPVEDEQVTVTHDRRPTVGSVFTTAISPDGRQTVYMDDTGSQLYVRNITNGSLQTAPAPSFNAAEWDYRRLGNTPIPISFQMAWRPNSDHIFLYNSIGVVVILFY
jgi:hypothetical protein